MNKVTLPKEVAEAIELMRKEGETNYDIINRANGAFITEPDLVLQRWAFDNQGGSPDELMRALVIGYEVEQSPEEKLREYYDESITGYVRSSTESARSYYIGETDGIKKALDILRVNIEGINA